MNRRALNFALAYSLLVIIYKLAIVLGGYTSTKFGFYYSNILSVIFIIPFYYVCIKMVRDKDYGGVISGREAIRIAFTILGVSMIIISLYNYIEFNWKIKDVSIEYYHSKEYLDVLTQQQLKYPDKLKTEDFPRIIEEQIRDASAFKATTGKIITMMFIGLGGAFVTAVFLKRSARQAS
jgi:hypothetical protein